MRSSSQMFGDRKNVMDSSMNQNIKIHKRHAALLFHRVRESIAAGIVNYQLIDEKHNPSDILSKNWAHNDI